MRQLMRWRSVVYLCVWCLCLWGLDSCTAQQVGSLGTEVPITAQGQPEASPIGWDGFVDRRTDALRRLAEPILACVARRDTSHPAFHGCVDWHSSVHGTYALLAIARITGDPGYRDAALRAVGPLAGVAAEAMAIRSGELTEEQPYGFAWALVLDVEADRAGLRSLHDVGVAARDRIVEHLARLGDTAAFYSAVAAPDYDNVTWATYALAQWSTHFADREAAASARAAAAQIFSERGRSGACLGSDDREFFSPCYLLPLLASALEAPPPGLVAQLPPLVDTAPLGPELPTVHSAGLTFSRSWGVYAAWRLSGDPALRDTWARLVTTQLAREDQWRRGYRSYAHWVAQFGVFSIAMTFDG